MRGSKVRFLTSLVIIAVAVIMLSSVACAQGLNAWPVWPGYHADMVHNGRNPKSTDLTNPASLGLVWVFPRPDEGFITDDRSVVDPAETVTSWSVGRSEDAYGTDDTTTLQRYFYRGAVPEGSGAGATAYWDFPGPGTTNNLPFGYYRVWVWVPVQPDAPNAGDPTYTRKAKYTVHDDSGETEVTFDQSEGGTWQLLIDEQFSFKDAAQKHQVELTNVTGDSAAAIKADNIRVVADAVKFVRGTGMEIYSSPVSATIDYNRNSSTGYTGRSPVVYVGTVEPPLANSANAPDTGAVYCIDSVTPTDKPKEGSGYKDLSEKLGEDIWRYPNRDVTLRDPLEGPIEGGIYSTPTLAHTEDGLVCLVTGMDRQIYALDAETGKLIWKGPGMTVSERDDWPNAITGRADAFGGTIRFTADTTPTSWRFEEKRDLTRDMVKNGEGWSYAVYAWIPPAGTGESAARTLGKYTITYLNSSGTTSTSKVTVDQSSAGNQGKWVQLGSSYFNVTDVSLEKAADISGSSIIVADAVMIVPDSIGAFSYCSPVVDNPLRLEDWPPAGGTVTYAKTLYAVTATGRALSFDIKGGQPGGVDRLCKVNWVYPGIRNKRQVTGDADADKPAMGLIGASPAYWKDGEGIERLFIASSDGKIRCIDAGLTNGGNEIWTYQDTQSGSDPFGGPMGLGGFTSSPTIDGANAQLFIGSTAGYFYCLDAKTKETAASSILKWKYPSADKAVPLGAFRYSTAVVGDSPYGTPMHRVWIGSSDGHIYTFDASETSSLPDGRRLWVEYPDATTQVRVVHGLDYTEPSLLSPIQGSIACDGAPSSLVTPNSTMTMYVGDMNGLLHWYSADSGRSDWKDPPTTGKNYTSYQTEGALFSSPNVTNVKITNSSIGLNKEISYVYVGCADGRIYAFSDDDGAWGGRWAGGYWPFEGTPDDDSRKLENPVRNTDVQFDIFPYDFFDQSDKHAVPPGNTIPSAETYWTDGKQRIVSEKMKMPDKTSIVSDKNGTPLEKEAYDSEIDTELRKAALERRNHVAPSLASRTGNSPLYFEWGETINLILWNLPELNSLSGTSNSSKRGSIRLNMTNTSAGESGGTQVKMAGRIRQLQEYTVLDQTSISDTTASSLEYSDGSDVKRSYALATIEINSSGRQPPSPGPGWTLTAEIRTKVTSGTSSSKSTYVTRIIPLARLIPKGASGEPEPFVADDNYQEQLLGINNPLAIRDDRTAGPPQTGEALAWPKVTGYPTDRTDDEAHYNGNGVGDNVTLSTGILPVMNLGVANHGTASREGWLGVMDRSATGTKVERGSPKTLDNFRISAGELRFNGGDGAIKNSGGTKFPWEFGAGSVDYPNIYKQRQGYRKATDDGDPANASTVLPPLVGPPATVDYDNCTMRPETVFVSVNVPRFQPANCGNTGYSRDMEAFIDSNRNGQWDSGNVIIGRPVTYQEAYRRFVTGVRVPPDPKIEVEEKMIDVGRAPHGLGEGLTGAYEFSPYNPTADIRQWFKPVTIKNAGNVNLPNMYIGRTTPMLSDQAGAISPMPVGAITSSLDWVVPPAFQAMHQLPFTSVNTDGTNLGYTLTKARVGDPDPSVMTIPDKRKWDMNYGGANVATEAALTALNTAFKTDLKVDQPLPVKVGVRVPLTQPIGGYYSFDTKYRLPYVPVFCDLGPNPNGILDLGEPVAESSFQLKASVRENQLTGGVTPMTLPQIDIPDDAGLTPRVGDATPAAFRDPTTGDVHLFWSSNRMFDTTLYPTDESSRIQFASAPWFINRASLHWNEHGSTRTGWQTAESTPDRWWIIPAAGGSPQLPMVQWPTLEGSGSDPNLMPWTFKGTSTGFYSVRHHSPVIAQTLTPTQATAIDPTWLAWIGTADMKDSVSEKVSQDHMIFYTNAIGGDVTAAGNPIFYINHDPGMVKRSPSLALYKDRMWMFWQGGNMGNWSIKYSTNDASGFPSAAWAEDSTLKTPDCLTSVSSPNCIFRRFWGNLTGSTPDYANGTVGRQLLDVVYAGTSKYGQSPDILLGRYLAITTGDATPSSAAQPMPRVFNEQLRRDSKYGYFTSQHLAWIRPDSQPSTIDVPYIHVVFPAGYILPQPGGTTITVSLEAIVSATDGSVIVDGSPVVAAQQLVPIYDDATGIYTYKYPDARTSAILGEMLVDFSAGVIRFTQPLNEVKVGDRFISPEVRADYTPRTWRLTTDAAVDNSPRAFIERTNMNKKVYPGLCDWSTTNGGTKPAPVDRLWVFWRKAGTGVNTSTIYYKTYRVGIDLTKQLNTTNPGSPLPVVKMNTNGTAANVAVNGNLGPWEVNRAGTKIYFSEVDERYRSLVRSLGAGPTNPISITYEPDAGQSVTVNDPDIYWIEEMPEQSLFGFSADGNVNEGSIYAFHDPDPKYYEIDYSGLGTWSALPSSKIWVFWTSTRGGTSDLFWETLSPNLAAD